MRNPVVLIPVVADEAPIVSICRSSLSGSHSSSLSKKAMYSPRARLMPALRAADVPELSESLTNLSRRSEYLDTTLLVRSADPSSTTTSSRSDIVCRKTLCTARPTHNSPLNKFSRTLRRAVLVWPRFTGRSTPAGRETTASSVSAGERRTPRTREAARLATAVRPPGSPAAPG